MEEYFDFKEFGWRKFSQEVWKRIEEAEVLDRAAKLAYFFLLSLFPLLLFLVMILGLLMSDSSEIQTRFLEYFKTVLPSSAHDLIKSSLGEINKGANSTAASFAVIFTWWSATQGMLAIIDSLNRAYKVEESRPFWKKFGVASGLTLVLLVLNFVTLVLLTYGGAYSQQILEWIGFGGLGSWVWTILHWSLLLFFVLLAFNLIYRYAPNIKDKGPWFTPGMILGVFLWIMVSVGFQIYLSEFNRYTVVYGSIGAVIILMLWLYLSGISLLLGGLCNSILRKNLQKV
jgi:membrane protein